MKSNHQPRRIRPALLFLALSIAGSALFSSCRTTKGFGEDLQKVGSKIEYEAAKRS